MVDMGHGLLVSISITSLVMVRNIKCGVLVFLLGQVEHVESKFEQRLGDFFLFCFKTAYCTVSLFK